VQGSLCNPYSIPASISVCSAQCSSAQAVVASTSTSTSAPVAAIAGGIVGAGLLLICVGFICRRWGCCRARTNPAPKAHAHTSSTVYVPPANMAVVIPPDSMVMSPLHASNY
jgi:hypothetical protein